MQLVKTTRDTLLRPLQIVSGIVERRHTMPILANILIRKDGESVSFLSTDTEVQITTHANIGSGPDVTGTTVAARKLLDILRALPESGDVTMTLANKRLAVQSGKSRFVLQTLAAEEFPTVSVAESHNATVTLPQKTLKHLFNMVHFAMAQQDIRYYLNGLLLVLDGNKVIAVATDGHRLAFCQVEAEQEFERQEVIIPRKTIIELQRLLEEKHGEIAALIVEPLLQGAGGMIVHPVEFLQKVRQLCNEHDVLPADAGEEWGVEKPAFDPGDTYGHVFTTPGTFAYYCSIHGTAKAGMIGTVVVLPADG